MQKRQKVLVFIMVAMTMAMPLFVNVGQVHAQNYVLPFAGVGTDYCLYYANSEMSAWTENTFVRDGIVYCGHIDLLNAWKPLFVTPTMGFTFPNVRSACSYYDEAKWETLLQLCSARDAKVIASLFPSIDSGGYCGSTQLMNDWLNFVDHWKGDTRMAAVQLYQEPTNGIGWNDAMKTNGVFDRKLLTKYFVILTHQIHQANHDPGRVVIFPFLGLNYYNPNDLFADFEEIKQETGIDILQEPNTIFDIVHPYLFDSAAGGDLGVTPEGKAAMYERDTIVPWYNKVGSAKIYCGETFMFVEPCYETGYVMPDNDRQQRFLTSMINVFVKYKMGFQLWTVLGCPPHNLAANGVVASFDVHKAAVSSSNYAPALPLPAPAPRSKIKTWYWTSDTEIYSVANGDLEGDDVTEIVTGGGFYDGARWVAQLCVWDGATLGFENVRTWYWTDDTWIESVVVGDVDGDAEMEVVTGGHYFDGTREVAQLCVWNGATLALENVKTWYWTGQTNIFSVAIGDFDGDAQKEIVTGGRYYDGMRFNSQLCVWSGASLGLEAVKTWYWTGDTSIESLAVGDLDGDAQTEIITGGYYGDGVRDVAQLCIWNGASLVLENIKTWFWTGDTSIKSLAVGDVDIDGNVEIVTGGSYYDSTRNIAQLCVWNGVTLSLEGVKAWYWTGNTYINSVVVGNVDGDSAVEIVTGGSYYDGNRWVAQLCVWNGATQALESVRTWYWTSHTSIGKVAVGDVDGEGSVEIVTGGSYNDGVRYNSQLCVWA